MVIQCTCGDRLFDAFSSNQNQGELHSTSFTHQRNYSKPTAIWECQTCGTLIAGYRHDNRLFFYKPMHEHKEKLLFEEFEFEEVFEQVD